MATVVATIAAVAVPVINGHDFYGRLVMPDAPTSRVWCSTISECAPAIDRKYGEVNVLFVSRCYTEAAFRWARSANPFRTLFVATDEKAYDNLSRGRGAYTVVRPLFWASGSGSCSVSPTDTEFRVGALCGLIRLGVSVVDPPAMPRFFGTGLVAAQDVRCDETND